MTDMILPFNNLKPSNPNIGLEIEAAVKRVLNSGWFILGPEVEAFEQAFAAAPAGAEKGL